jgi:hypothetical protein
MPSFAEAVTALIPQTFGPQVVATAMAQVGGSAQLTVDGIPNPERAGLIDRFVRNLKGISTTEGARVERTLLLGLHCQPPTPWSSQLESSVALIGLRNHLKHVLLVLGLDWADLSRMQSVIGGVARWLQGSGGASLEVFSDVAHVDCRIVANDRTFTPSLLQSSPMVKMLESPLTRVQVVQNTDRCEILVRINRAA